METRNKVICMPNTAKLELFEQLGFIKTTYISHYEYAFYVNNTKRIYFDTKSFKIYFNQVNKEVLIMFQMLVEADLIQWATTDYWKEFQRLKEEFIKLKKEEQTNGK